ncbi:hypothetical protein DMN91_002716 [Ooceraea biroi]|uniref:UDP-glucuronosyltransferase 1-9 n=1 Tax=Ooceraea biroi TaxID=2015173 RepID=A0A026WPZ7_OOCBI|nr:UDP-glucuronosyltransferase 2B15 [Ooceraea biroi]XP_011333326.1 UDP-glucuronosyltransferase 2B15 [Ooceraea biroi]EZA57756.1 UDP-glucuronosyltransferase 1-9 [Ooceraea biroi]RLU24627.1 hypothetical protein DMN91_002716 [Ooceraea biroi]
MKILLSVLLVILICTQIIGGYRILGVAPLQSKSHWILMEALMKNLAIRGHQVDVITQFSLKKPIPNYTEINIGGIVPELTNNLNATGLEDYTSLTTIPRTLSLLGSKTCELLGHPKLQELIKNSQQNPPYDVIVVSLFLSPCYLAFGRYFKVPMIGLVTTSFYDWLNHLSGNQANPAYIPSYFSTFEQRMNFRERLTNFLLTNMYTMQMSYYSDAQVQHVKTHFGMDVPSMDDLHSDIALYLVNSHHSLNEIRPMNPGIIEVSGLHLKDDDDPLPLEMQKWLDESTHGCIYFTFGSMVRIETFPEELMKQIYASFEKIAPVRVLMKVAKKEDLLPGLPENVMTNPWFPQISILKHKNIRAFITHGGLMGTMEAVYHGVPLIGISLFSDQHRNMKNFVNKKVAISLQSINDITEERLSSALNKILKDPSYRNNMQRLQKLFLDRPMSPLNTSIYWVEYVAKYGNVLQSPALQLYWWQRNLLDVYAFIFVVIATVLYITLYSLRKLKNFLFGSRASKNSAAARSKKDK